LFIMRITIILNVIHVDTEYNLFISYESNVDVGLIDFFDSWSLLRIR
jgi:hypothetical protein